MEYNYESAAGYFSLWVSSEIQQEDVPIAYDSGGTIIGGDLIKAHRLKTPIFNETHSEYRSSQHMPLDLFMHENRVLGYRYLLEVISSKVDIKIPVNYLAFFNYCYPNISIEKKGKFIFLGSFEYDSAAYRASKKEL